MNQFFKVLVLFSVVFATLAPATMVFAADPAPEAAAPSGNAEEVKALTLAQEAGKTATAKGQYGIFAAAIGAGLVIIGGAMGIGKIGANTVESMARQPEIAGAIQTAMIISAALIEGVTFFALIICLLGLFM